MYSLPKNVYRERKDFSKIKTTIPIPNLIEIQRKSYERFLQMNRLPSEREDAASSRCSSRSSRSAISARTRRSSSSSTRSGTGSASAASCRGSTTCASRAAIAARRSWPIPTATAKSCARAAARANQARGDVCDICGNTVSAEAEVRRRRVPGARHDLRRAAEGDDPSRGVEQGPRDRREDHPRHQGAGGLLRRHPADDGERHVHHQRHRARHRQPAAPFAGRVLPLGRQDAVRRADHPVPRLVGRVRVRHEEPALRPHRPQAEVPRLGVPARPRPARRRRDHPDLLHASIGWSSRAAPSTGPSTTAWSGSAPPRTSSSPARTSPCSRARRSPRTRSRR